MILSMTGYGSAEHTDADSGVSYVVEIRTVNHRYVKINQRLPEWLQFAEPVVDKMLRDRIRRGSVVFALKTKSRDPSKLISVRRDALEAYLQHAQAITRTIDKSVREFHATVDLAVLMTLPGVCDSFDLDEEVKQQHLAIIRCVTHEALGALTSMRRQEGEAVEKDLQRSCDAIREQLKTVSRRAPSVVEEYHERLKTRVQALLSNGRYELEEQGLMREVAIYAERCDISEEVSRLSSHLDQFMELLDRGEGEQVGRTLDFLTQELLREANTIASKSNDVTIARSIVEVKGCIDRLKEQVQNVE